MIIIVVVLCLSGAVFATGRLGGFAPVTAGSRAPNFHAWSLTGVHRQKSLDDYRGDVVLVNIWATWCPPCRAEMPSIQALYREFGSKGLHVVAVSIDDPGQEVHIREFTRTLGLSFEILYDPTGAIARQYQAIGVPGTFLIGRNGVIRKNDGDGDGLELRGEPEDRRVPACRETMTSGRP